MKKIYIKVPARICFYGDHQDYLGLPVIAGTINRYIKIYAKENNNLCFNIEMPDIKQKRVINIQQSLLKANQGDYFLLKIKPFNYLGKIVSSTKIRNLLKKGDITLVNKLLSRTWSIEGKVIVGNKIGRKLGYRTCNIDVKNYILPRLGIYAVKISIENKKNIYGGVAYLGSRPTFGGKDIFLEINIFGIKQNLYKKNLKIYFLKFLRKDKKFMNSSQLMRQMNKDVIFAKKGLKTKLVL